MTAAASALLDREARSLVQRLRLWTPARWAAAAPGAEPVPGSRADVAHHLAQALADTAAALEGGLARTVPRLDSDLALPDQLAVTAHDLVRAGPPDDVARDAVCHLLLHRWQLLDDPVPAGLATALDAPDALEHGRRVCRS